MHASGNVPDKLKPFATAVFCQDQRNSRVKYTSDGYIDTTSCGTGHTIDDPCTNSAYANCSTPGMTLQARPNLELYGVVYTPRGSSVTLQGHGNLNSPTILATGAMSFQGGADLRMLDSSDSLHQRIVVLIE